MRFSSVFIVILFFFSSFLNRPEESTSLIEDKLSETAILSDNLDDCKLAFNGIDPNTLQKKIATAYENIITYTHPKLEEYYKEQSFLSGEVSLVQLGKNKYLTLDIIIRSKDAIRNYGMIQVGSPMKIELIDGESAYLFAQANATGTLIPYTSNIKYQVLYLLEKSEYKRLAKMEINNLGIMWSSGYEKYDIYNIDVIMNQINCLENYN